MSCRVLAKHGFFFETGVRVVFWEWRRVDGVVPVSVSMISSRLRFLPYGDPMIRAYQSIVKKESRQNKQTQESSGCNKPSLKDKQSLRVDCEQAVVESSRPIQIGPSMRW